MVRVVLWMKTDSMARTSIEKVAKMFIQYMLEQDFEFDDFEQKIAVLCSLFTQKFTEVSQWFLNQLQEMLTCDAASDARVKIILIVIAYLADSKVNT
jgi:hypothetical protein